MALPAHGACGHARARADGASAGPRRPRPVAAGHSQRGDERGQPRNLVPRGDLGFCARERPPARHRPRRRGAHRRLAAARPGARGGHGPRQARAGLPRPGARGLALPRHRQPRLRRPPLSRRGERGGAGRGAGAYLQPEGPDAAGLDPPDARPEPGAADPLDRLDAGLRRGLPRRHGLGVEPRAPRRRTSRDGPARGAGPGRDARPPAILASEPSGRRAALRADGPGPVGARGVLVPAAP